MRVCFIMLTWQPSAIPQGEVPACYLTKLQQLHIANTSITSLADAFSNTSLLVVLLAHGNPGFQGQALPSTLSQASNLRVGPFPLTTGSFAQQPGRPDFSHHPILKCGWCGHCRKSAVK